jgi:hypothetical protein
MSRNDPYGTIQVHANANIDGADAGLRVSITMYDESGHEMAHKTWRKHVRALQVDGLDWQAYSAVVDLCRMMGEIASGQATDHIAVDTPLF